MTGMRLYEIVRVNSNSLFSPTVCASLQHTVYSYKGIAQSSARDLHTCSRADFSAVKFAHTSPASRVYSRSTADAILTLRLLTELHREFDKPLHTAFIDIKSAFDSLRKALAAKETSSPFSFDSSKIFTDSQPLV